MSLNLATLSPKTRASYILIGRQFGSPDTLAQANQTLQGLSAHGVELVQHGFAQEDAERLHDARDALSAATVGRSEARGEKKVTNATYVAEMKAGKVTRGSARSVLTSARRALDEQGGADAEDAVKLIDATLAQTKTAGDEAGKLAEQHDMLRGTLASPAVAAAAEKRGGPQAVTNLEAGAAKLRAAAAGRAGAMGTPIKTEELDLLDGLIVTLARHARKAARSAATWLGKPALAADFELTKLYDTRSAAPAKAPAAPAAAPAPKNGAPASPPNS
jgi:hypothetical protein